MLLRKFSYCSPDAKCCMFKSDNDLHKLTYYRVKNSAITLLRSYLSNCKQYVQIDDVIRRMLFNGMVWYGMVWYGMVWYGMVWYGNCLFDISSLRFHNGLTHFLAFRDNQEKLNYRAIRQEILIIIVLVTCIGTKIKRCTKNKGQGHSQ